MACRDIGKRCHILRNGIFYRDGRALEAMKQTVSGNELLLWEFRGTWIVKPLLEREPGGKIDYGEFDRRYRYDDRERRLELANRMGYGHISQATHLLYLELGSLAKLARRLKTSRGQVTYELQRLGVLIKGRGGSQPARRKGDKRLRENSTRWTR